MKTPNAVGWWLRDGRPTRVYADIGGCSIRYNHFDESGAMYPGRVVVDDGHWQGPVRCGTVIEGKRPTREQNDGVERVMGFWNRVVSSEQVAAIGLPYADSITFRGLTYTADGSDDLGTLWHAIDAHGYPLDLGVE